MAAPPGARPPRATEPRLSVAQALMLRTFVTVAVAFAKTLICSSLNIVLASNWLILVVCVRCFGVWYGVVRCIFQNARRGSEHVGQIKSTGAASAGATRKLPGPTSPAAASIAPYGSGAQHSRRPNTWPYGHHSAWYSTSPFASPQPDNSQRARRAGPQPRARQI